MSSKNNLIAKTKMEYNKLKDDYQQLKKTNENLQKFFYNKGNKVNINDLSNSLKEKENDLNEARRMMHIHIDKIKNILKDSDFDNYSEELNSNLISAKTIEDKFYYYFEKVKNYIDNLKLEEKHLKEELDNKEKDINFLKRKNNIYDSINMIQKNEPKTINYKGRNNALINALIKNDLRKTVKKRKINDTQILSFSNIKLNEDNLENNIENNISVTSKKNFIYSNLPTNNSTNNQNIIYPNTSNKENITSMFKL